LILVDANKYIHFYATYKSKKQAVISKTLGPGPEGSAWFLEIHPNFEAAGISSIFIAEICVSS
jgi:hypothetical protein